MSAREPIQYIEIIRDKCNLSFGVGACQATGEPCFNTANTCKFYSAYPQNVGTQKDIFINPDNCDASVYSQLGDAVYPFLKSVSHTPATINPANSNTGASALGTRATIKVTFTDAFSDDQHQDPYFHSRAPELRDAGTFFGKYFARNKYLQYRQVNWISAELVGGVISNKKTRTYVLTDITNSDASGNAGIVAQDALVLANIRGAQYPVPNTAQTFADITAAQDSVVVAPALGSDGRLDDDVSLWPAASYVRIDDEILRYTSKSGNTLNVVRGQLGSTADTHDAESTVQLVGVIEDKFPWEIIRDILQASTSIPAELYDFTQWQQASAIEPWLQLQYTAYISEPMGVMELLEDISQQMLFFPYFNEEANKIHLKAVIAELSSVPIKRKLTAFDGFIADSFKMKQNDNEVITRVNSFVGIRNWAEDLKDENNYRARLVLLSGEDTHDRRRHVKAANLLGYFLSDAQADFMGRQLLRQLGDTPTTFDFKLDAKDSDIELADFVELEHRLIVDTFGQKVTKKAQIISAKEAEGMTWDYRASSYTYYPMPDFEGNYAVSIPVNVNNLNLRTLFDQERQSVKLQSGDTVTFVVGSGVTIGATSTGNLALQTGSWPAGVELILDCTAGSIAVDGVGGNGGAGGAVVFGGIAVEGENGTAGGHAMSLQHQMTIVGSPQIRGGGGGGGGGGGFWARSTQTSATYGAGGGGGGGGQGLYSTSGGAKGVATSVGNAVDGTAGSNGSRSGAGSAGIGGVLVFPVNAYGGNGGNGGSWGQPGQSGSNAFFGGGLYEYTARAGGSGGAAGKAVAAGNNLLTAPDAIFYGARSN